ncbi:unnamed protein product, partial [Laminaria digitata]
WRDAEVRVKAEAIATCEKEFPAGGGNAPTDAVRADEEVDRRAAVVDSAGAAAAGGSPFVEAWLEGVRAKTVTVAEVAERVTRDAELQTGGRAVMDGVVGAGEVGRSAAVVDDAGAGAAGGFSSVEVRLKRLQAEAVKKMQEARLERLQAEGVKNMQEGAARDAASQLE